MSITPALGDQMEMGGSLKLMRASGSVRETPILKNKRYKAIRGHPTLSDLNMQPHICTHTYAIKHIHHTIYIIYCTHIYHIHYQRTEGQKAGEEEVSK